MKTASRRPTAYEKIVREKRTFLYTLLCIGALMAGTIMIYGQDLEITFGNALIFTSGNIGNYVLAVPFMAGVVLYRKRQVIRAVISREDERGWFTYPIGACLILIAAILFLYGSSTLYSTYFHLYSMVIFLSGAIMIVFNLGTFRHTFFALALLAFLQPIPGEFIGGAAADISWISALILQNVLHASSITSVLNTQLGAPAFVLTKQGGQQNTFVIGEPSSGVFSTIGMSLFALFVAYISGGKFWKRAVVFAISFPLFFLLNTSRIGLIMLIWYFLNTDAAESFHLVGGMLMVTLGTILLLLFGEKVFKIPYIRPRFSIRKCATCDISSNLREDFCLMCGRRLTGSVPRIKKKTGISILFVVGIASLLLAANNASTTVDSSKGIESLNVRGIQGPETLPYVLPQISNYHPVYAYRDQASESILNLDLALAYRYVMNNSTQLPYQNTLTYVGIQISNSKHTWETSLVGYPSSVGRPTATVIKFGEIAISPFKTGTFFMYQRPGSNSTEAVIYWFERLPLNFGNHFENRNVFIVLWLYTDNLAREQIIKNPEDIQGTEKYMLSFARPISDFWGGIASHAITYSFLNDFMNRYAFSLIVLITFMTFGWMIYVIVKRMIINARFRTLLEELSVQSEKMVILATAQCHYPTLGKAIAAKFDELHPEGIEPKRFIDILRMAREAGFLQNAIAARNDIPYLIWRSRIKNESFYLSKYSRLFQRGLFSRFGFMRLHNDINNELDQRNSKQS